MKFPSYSTFRRVLKTIDFQPLTDLFNTWALAIASPKPEEDWQLMLRAFVAHWQIIVSHIRTLSRLCQYLVTNVVLLSRISKLNNCLLILKDTGELKIDYTGSKMLLFPKIFHCVVVAMLLLIGQFCTAFSLRYDRQIFWFSNYPSSTTCLIQPTPKGFFSVCMKPPCPSLQGKGVGGGVLVPHKGWKLQ